jgi:hypothetical protein
MAGRLVGDQVGSRLPRQGSEVVLAQMDETVGLIPTSRCDA